MSENKALRPYEVQDQETGEVFSKVLYMEGYPQQVRANMKLGQFFIGDDETDGRKEITMIPLAMRSFRGQMFLTNEDLEKIAKDESGEEYERSIKNWVEIFWLDKITIEGEEAYMLTCTLFKTWGFTELKNVLMRPRPIKKKGRLQMAQPIDLSITISTEKSKTAKGEFYVPKISKVTVNDAETVEMLEAFVADHKLYSIENFQQSLRFSDTYQLMGKPFNWHNPVEELKLLADAEEPGPGAEETDTIIEPETEEVA